MSFRSMIAVLGAIAALTAGCHRDEPPASPEAEGTTEASPALGSHVDGAQARTLVEEGAFLLDVRTPQEFASGHLEGAANIPVQELSDRMGEVPSGTPIVVYCRTGNRSSAAARMLRNAGHETYDLGPMSAW